MFKKNCRVGSTALLKSSEKRKFIQLVIKCFPSVTEAILETAGVLSTKESLSTAKIQGFPHAILYLFKGELPVFFDTTSNGDIYPTVFTLHRIPTILPVLYTHPYVSNRILGGADLMLPGVSFPPEGLGIVEIGQKRAIQIRGNPYPFAVGKMLVNGQQMIKSGMRGKGLEVVHFYTDALWQVVPRDVCLTMLPPGYMKNFVARIEENGQVVVHEADEDEEGQAAYDDEEEEVEEGVAEHESGAESSAAAREKQEHEDDSDGDESGELGVEQEMQSVAISAPASSSEPAKPTITAEQMDLLIFDAFLTAIASRITDKELPMSVGPFYSQRVMPSNRSDIPLNMKKSSYKSWPNFLKSMQKAQLIEFRVISNDSDFQITKVHRSKPEIVERVALVASLPADAFPSFSSSSSEEQPADGNRLVEIVPMFKPISSFSPIFSLDPLRSRDKLYEKQECHLYLNQYLDEVKAIVPVPSSSASSSSAPKKGKEAQQFPTVVLDDFLAETLFAKEAQRGNIVPLPEVHLRMMAKMQTWYKLKKANGLETFKKGSPAIHLQHEKKNGKDITRIEGLDSLDLDLKTLQHELQKVCAASTTIGNVVGKKEGTMEVVVQGNMMTQVARYLMETYSVPKTSFELFDKVLKKEIKKF